MTDGHWLAASDKPALLIAMMKALAGDAHISFEGDLAGRDRLSPQPGSSDAETEVLKRNTLEPRQGFVVLPLEPETIRPILDAVLPKGRTLQDILHVQIEKRGQLEFGAYDNFHPECTWAGSGVSEALLQELLAKGILRSFGCGWRGY